MLFKSEAGEKYCVFQIRDFVNGTITKPLVRKIKCRVLKGVRTNDFCVYVCVPTVASSNRLPLSVVVEEEAFGTL